ncbi:MAG TPA: GNAT family N-acetyltransferase [Crocinitomicaceae bacterium]|nr:GNAT family N-acetyltransferase [Crocinitomicaceae bacterium]
MHLNWQIKHFNELSINEFHDIIALRIKVFVVEQDCPYQDLDGKDKKCYHVICRDGKGNIVATARILPPGISYDSPSIGRVVIENEIRGEGIGHELMNKCVDYSVVEFGNAVITISAQKHLEKYYREHNFISTGKEYLEDGIPHVEMTFSPTK